MNVHAGTNDSANKAITKLISQRCGISSTGMMTDHRTKTNCWLNAPSQELNAGAGSDCRDQPYRCYNGYGRPNSLTEYSQQSRKAKNALSLA